MRGRKPTLENVVPMVPAGAPGSDAQREFAEKERAKLIGRQVRALMPKGLDDDLKVEWRRVARLLADPTVDRLKPRFVDVIVEYCRVTVRLRKFREAMPTLAREIYNAAPQVTKPDGETEAKPTRNGIQIKNHPFVAQMNEAWRQWRSLVQMLGLSPADERGMIPGQGDLFDDAESYFH